MSQSPGTTALMYNHNYRIGVREIIYQHRSMYKGYNEMLMLEHKLFSYTDRGIIEWGKGSTIAAGLLVDLYRTNLIPIDVDAEEDYVMDALVKKIKHPEVEAIDLLGTGRHNHWHIYIGLREPKNIEGVINSPGFRPCKGFQKISLDLGEAVIRTSPKWNIQQDGSVVPSISSSITPRRIMRKEDEIMVDKSHQQVFFNSITEEIPKKNTIDRPVRLRG